MSCAVCELADRYDLGADVSLESVPLKYPKMTPWEIWISESQERMCLGVPPSNLERVLQIFRDEQTEATPIGRFTEGDIVRVRYRGVVVAELEMRTLFSPPRVRRSNSWKPPRLDEPNFRQPSDLGEILKRLLAAPNIASKEIVVRRYDQEVKGCTVIKPLQGWNAGPSDAAVLKPLDGSWRGVSISGAMNPSFGKIDPYWMAASVIDESIRNGVAVGGRRMALLDNFTWGNPEREDRLGGLISACRACYDIAKTYGAPFISGKDSLYNESPLGPVAPTLLITAVGMVPDVRKIVTMDLKNRGDLLYLLGVTRHELGGSEYYRLLGHLGASVPKLDAEKTAETYGRLTSAIDAGLVRACHDLSEGGLAVSAAEMAFTGGRGLEIDLGSVAAEGPLREDVKMFSESNGRLLVEVPAEQSAMFEEAMSGATIRKIGFVSEGDSLVVRSMDKTLIDVPLVELNGAWKTPLGGTR